MPPSTRQRTSQITKICSRPSTHLVSLSSVRPTPFPFIPPSFLGMHVCHWLTFVLGFYLSALTFIEDGNKDLVQPEGHTQPLINFFKRSLSADILRDIHQYQSQPYNLARCKPVYDYICSGLEVVEKSGDLYEMSLVLEPREREEERM